MSNVFTYKKNSFKLNIQNDKNPKENSIQNRIINTPAAIKRVPIPVQLKLLYPYGHIQLELFKTQPRAYVKTIVIIL